MNTEQIIEQLLQTGKWYLQYGIKQQTASATIKAIKHGTIKHKTLIHFMAKLGYKIQNNINWVRK